MNIICNYTLWCHFTTRVHYSYHATRYDVTPPPVYTIFTFTFLALLYFCLIITPISRKGGATFQQVFSSQLPDIPWHLHWTCTLPRTIWINRNTHCLVIIFQWLFVNITATLGPKEKVETSSHDSKETSSHVSKDTSTQDSKTSVTLLPAIYIVSLGRNVTCYTRRPVICRLMVDKRGIMVSGCLFVYSSVRHGSYLNSSYPV